MQKELQAADATLAAAEEKHTATVQPISARLMEVRQKLSDASTASDQLLRTCDEPQLRAEQEAANSELSLLIRQRQELETQLSQLRNQSELRTAVATKETHEPRVAGLRAEAEQLQTQIDRGQKMLKANERKMQETSASRSGCGKPERRSANFAL